VSSVSHYVMSDRIHSILQKTRGTDCVLCGEPVEVGMKCVSRYVCGGVKVVYHEKCALEVGIIYKEDLVDGA